MDKKEFVRPEKQVNTTSKPDVKETFLVLDKISNLILQAKVVTTKLKATYPENTYPEIAEALDDATGAIDITQHHLEDIKAMLFED